MGRFRVHLSCASPALSLPRPRALRSRVCFTVGGRLLSRDGDSRSRFFATGRHEGAPASAWLVVVPPDEDDLKRAPNALQARRELSTVGPGLHCRRDFARVRRLAILSTNFHTTIHRVWMPCAASPRDAHLQLVAVAKPHHEPMSRVQPRRCRQHRHDRDRHASASLAMRLGAIASLVTARHRSARDRWTRAPIGLTVSQCRFHSRRSCPAPRR